MRCLSNIFEMGIYFLRRFRLIFIDVNDSMLLLLFYYIIDKKI